MNTLKQQTRPLSILTMRCPALWLAICSLSHADITSTAYVAYNSKWIFRGYDSAEGDSNTVYSLTLKGASTSELQWYTSVWSADALNQQEIDIMGGVIKDFETYSINLGYLYYTYPISNSDADAELMLKVSGKYDQFQYQVQTYFGVQGGLKDEVWSDLSFRYKMPLGSHSLDWTFKSGSSIEFPMAYSSLTLSSTLELSDENITFTPYIAYMETSDSFQSQVGDNGAIKPTFEGVFGGMTLSFAF